MSSEAVEKGVIDVDRSGLGDALECSCIQQIFIVCHLWPREWVYACEPDSIPGLAKLVGGGERW